MPLWYRYWDAMSSRFFYYEPLTSVKRWAAPAGAGDRVEDGDAATTSAAAAASAAIKTRERAPPPRAAAGAQRGSGGGAHSMAIGGGSASRGAARADEDDTVQRFADAFTTLCSHSRDVERLMAEMVDAMGRKRRAAASTCSALDAQRARGSQLEENSRRQVTELGALRVELATCQQERNELRARAAVQQRAHEASAESAQAQIARMRDESARSRTALDALQSEASALRDRGRAAGERERECQSLRRELDALRRELAVARSHQVSVLLFTVTFYANLAHNLTRSP